MNIKILRNISLSALALLPLSALASTATTTLQVTATVVAGCKVDASGGTVAFGNYDPTAASDTTANGSLSVTCTNGTDYQIELDQGAATGATVTTRQMKDSGSNYLPYALYRDASHSLNWGKTDGTDTLGGQTGTGTAQTIPVYGVLPAGATAPAGSYSDTVNVTVVY